MDGFLCTRGTHSNRDPDVRCILFNDMYTVHLFFIFVFIKVNAYKVNKVAWMKIDSMIMTKLFC